MMPDESGIRTPPAVPTSPAQENGNQQDNCRKNNSNMPGEAASRARIACHLLILAISIMQPLRLEFLDLVTTLEKVLKGRAAGQRSGHEIRPD